MANSRQGGAFGFLRKSIGSVTYSTIKDGKGKRIQVARSKPTEVANPNTVAQIIQRMKVKPAARFYNAFSEVLNNAFESVAYGPASRRHFMGLAMAQTGPYVPKGATRFIPAKYPVSEGGLQGIDTVYAAPTYMSNPLFDRKSFLVMIAGTDDEDVTFEEFVAQNYGTEIQLTFLVVTQAEDGTFVPHYGRVLSSAVPATAQGVQTIMVGDGFSVYRYGGALNIYGEAFAVKPQQDAAIAAAAKVVAAAVIVSRKDGENWLRSNTTMVITDALEVNLYGQEAMQAAIESYQSAQGVNSLNSSWYLNLANGQPFYGQLRNMNYTLEFEGAEQSVIQRDVVIPIGYVVNENGALRSQIPADADGNLIVLSNGSYTTMADPSDGAAADAKVKVSDVYLQITGSPTTYLWKEAYAIQIMA